LVILEPIYKPHYSLLRLSFLLETHQANNSYLHTITVLSLWFVSALFFSLMFLGVKSFMHSFREFNSHARDC